VGSEPRKEINDDRSRNVYENKQKHDNLTERKGEIYTKLSDVLRKNTRILLKPSRFCHVRD